MPVPCGDRHTEEVAGASPLRGQAPKCQASSSVRMPWVAGRIMRRRYQAEMCGVAGRSMGRPSQRCAAQPARCRPC